MLNKHRMLRGVRLHVLPDILDLAVLSIGNGQLVVLCLLNFPGYWIFDIVIGIADPGASAQGIYISGQVIMQDHFFAICQINLNGITIRARL